MEFRDALPCQATAGAAEHRVGKQGDCVPPEIGRRLRLAIADL